MNRRAPCAALVGAVILALTASGIAAAHVVRQFGPYTIALGWLGEPTYVGEHNAIVAVVKDAAGNPVNDLASGDLTVTVSAGGQSTAALPLDPSYDEDTGLGTPGEYTADMIPTIPGDYTFHLAGKVHDTAVDETATSSDTTFNSVEDPASVQFPVKVPTTTEISDKVDKLDSRLTSATAEASGSADAIKAATDAAGAATSAVESATEAFTAAQATANEASNAANRALIVGAVVGGIGILLGLAGIILGLRARRRA
jgi:hypothetical protein